MKKFALLIFLQLLIIAEVKSQQCANKPPTNLFLTDGSACSATLHWSSQPNIMLYQVRYRLAPNGVWSPRISIGTDTFYTFTGLLANKSYEFAVRARCNDGSFSPEKSKQSKTKICMLPTSTSAEPKDDGSLLVHVSLSCPSDTIHYRYKPLGGNWTTAFVLNTSTISLTNLNQGSQYVYQVSTCPLSMNNWTSLDTVDLLRPNFMLIILDDSRYDSYSCNGGPSWFQSSNIDRIANEGVNFKSSFVVYSFCTPSRGTIVTGLYPHKNGAVDNTSTIYPHLPNLATILDEAGYNTGMIGKYTIGSPQAGYDYWLSAEPEYIDAKYNFNGTPKTITGHNTDVLTDSAVAFITRSYEPFYLWLAFHAPHDSAIVQPTYEGIFEGKQMPIPANTAEYNKNYPSFLDSLPDNFYLTPSEIPPAYQGYYELLAGIDQSVGSLLNLLESIHELNNTMIIFMSDNGHTYGEHGLFVKQLAYEPSIRIPLFIRYPTWFESGTVVSKQMSLNIDIAPTIVEAAGIDDTFDFDGVSLKKLSDGSVKRKDMFYEFLGVPGDLYENIPYCRGVRSFNYKYVYYGCSSDTVEEFFNLKSDPLEKVNLINNSSYSNVIQTYRNRLKEMQIEFDDTIEGTNKNCYINNPKLEKLFYKDQSDDFISIYPNPSDGKFHISINSAEQSVVSVISALGQEVYQKEIFHGEEELNLQLLPKGIYFIRVRTMNDELTRKIILQ